MPLGISEQTAYVVYERRRYAVEQIVLDDVATDQIIIAATTNKTIIILGGVIALSATGTVKLQSSDGSNHTLVLGPINCSSTTNFALPYNPIGWAKSASGLGIRNVNSTGTLRGCLIFIKV